MSGAHKHTHICSRMRNRRPNPPRETDEQWRVRARRAWDRRNDPRPPPTPMEAAMLALYSLNYDVLDGLDSEKEAFSDWMSARADRSLWSYSYIAGCGGNPDGPFDARYAGVERVERFKATTWAGLRAAIEAVHP